MQHPVHTHDSPAANSEDHSTCLEAYGFLNQSYDSLDHLLRDLAHHGGTQATDHAAVVEVAVVGEPEVLMPFSHLFL
jgi:hypothetical protein